MRTLKALVLLSGGLDSLLAARVLRDLGAEVRGVVFDTGFFGLERPGERLTPSGELRPMLRRLEPETTPFGISLGLQDVSTEFLDLLLHPLHGYGSAVNPCIDCKILFLRRAKEMLAAWGGDVVATGEVIGQRPMSQNPQSLGVIERESGCEGILLRPLSAQLLAPTRAETAGLIDRSRLLAFSGRTRKPQMDLAGRLGITTYAQPAGGCILTEENFALRFRDWLQHHAPGTPLVFADVARLRLGRHFRLPGGSKVIVGRNAEENGWLETYRGPCLLARPADLPGPTALIEENGDAAARVFAAAAVARYTATEPGQSVAVEWCSAEKCERLEAVPAADELLQSYRL